ncbi:MAG TPA: DUF4382 domain-containing protein [Gammaproteobacteria bacterium]|jgi:hypothetical protein|nr:DUF4382 domain-containing protein [Gammaproteobacteria bacterium]
MKTRHRAILLVLTAAALLSLNGCGWDSSSNPTVIDLFVADTPVDGADSVVIDFTGVQIQGATGAPVEYDFPTPMSIDVLQHEDDDFNILLDQQGIAHGHYQWIRLMVDMSKSSITLADGSQHPLVILSGDQTGLKLVSGFDVGSGQEVSLTVDFDLRKSITLASGTYDFTPAMRLVDNSQVVSMEGFVSNTFLIGATAVTAPTCDPAAYIYAGSNITPVDINPTSKVQPVATAAVYLDSFTGSYKYAADFLTPGTYTVALVCAAGDDPAKADSLTFAEPQTVTLSTGFFTEVDFP